MEKVKIFGGYKANEVEEDANTFLEKFGNTIEIKKRSFEMSIWSSNIYFSVAIFYEEK